LSTNLSFFLCLDFMLSFPSCSFLPSVLLLFYQTTGYRGLRHPAQVYAGQETTTD
jgi:hypothetical protein